MTSRQQTNKNKIDQKKTEVAAKTEGKRTSKIQNGSSNLNSDSTSTIEYLLENFVIWFDSDPVTPKLVILWLLGVVISGAILFMLLVGMLNREVTDPDRKDYWIEVNSQILNAFFFGMVVCLQPERLYMIFLFFYNFESCQRYIGISSARGLPDSRDLSDTTSLGSTQNTTVQLSETLSSTIDLSESSSSTSSTSSSSIDLSNSGTSTSTSSSSSSSNDVVIPLLSKSKIFKILFLLEAHCVCQYIISYHMWKFDADTRPALVVELSLVCACFFASFAGWLQNRWIKRWFERHENTEKRLDPLLQIPEAVVIVDGNNTNSNTNKANSNNNNYNNVSLINYSAPSAAL